MGYFLLRESMLDSVVRARDRLLKPGGVMMPSSATMFWGLLSCEEDRLGKQAELAESLRDWQEFTDETARCYGVDMGCLTPAYKKEQRDYFSLSSQWQEVPGSQVVSEPVALKHFDLYKCTVADVQGVDEAPFAFKIPALDPADAAAAAAAKAATGAAASEEGAVAPGCVRVSAFAGWFDAAFEGSPAHPAEHKVVLSTAPKVGYTHWGQQVFYFQDPVDLSPGDSLEGTLKMYRTKDNSRLYKVDVAFSVRRSGDAFGGAKVVNTYEIP
jgi:protein arginine N-methyltransferase 1